MKIFRKIVIGLVAVIALIFIIGLFTRKEYAVEREITINKPKAEVFEYVKHIKNQETYSVWAMRDPNMKKAYRGTDGTVGFVSGWDSQDENVGKGEQEIKKITEGDRVDVELRFYKPFEATDNAYMITESENENTTIVKWGFNGKMNYPMNLMLLVFDFDEVLGNDLETGLQNLKANLEK